jgi:hypothetical protein
MRQVISWALAIIALGTMHCALSAEHGPTAIDEARNLAASHQFEKAAILLEEALPTAPEQDRPKIIALLRQTYQNLIRQAEASGKNEEAATYRDNLSIIEGAGDAPSPVAPDAVPPTPAGRPVQAQVPSHPVVRPVSEPEPQRLPRSSLDVDASAAQEPPQLPEPEATPPLDGPVTAAASPPTAPSESGAQSGQIPSRSSTPTAPNRAGTSPPNRGVSRGTAPTRDAAVTRTQGQANPGAADLAQADQLFSAKKYEAAGKIYALLASQNRLPAYRKEAWAYCRWVFVVGRINAHPRTSQEWDAIEQEIRSIQRLTPGNWYGEYLLNRVSEARSGSRPPRKPGRVVVRGSAPDEPAPRNLRGLLGRGRSSGGATVKEPDPGTAGQPLQLPQVDSTGEDTPTSRARQQSSTLPAPGVASGEGNPASSDLSRSWQVLETDHFRVFHVDPELARKAADAAEAVRARQTIKWGSPASKTGWSPRCDLYLYPTPGDFARMTGQSETSPGFSTMSINGSRVIARRVNLRADHPQLLTAILPHEVTHVVLADLFIQQQIPRWADEGMAVLSEPEAEQRNRVANLDAPIREGRVFKLSELMAIDYPNDDARSLYYDQSVSLTQFLVKLGTPEQFIAFVRDAQQKGVDVALREVYQIEGIADLETRWMEFARRQIAQVASSRDSDTARETTTR